MTVKEAQRFIHNALQAAGIDSARAETRLLIEHLLGANRADILSQGQKQLSQEQQRTLSQWLKRRTNREPLQHILGKAHFYGLDLKVNEHVLIPRPETEQLVSYGLSLIKRIKKPKVLDIATGSGAIALAIKHERPDAVVKASDISKKAIKTAKDNAQRYDLDIAFFVADLLKAVPLQRFAHQLDLLTANLPYLPETDKPHLPPEVTYDPALALFSGSDGLTHFRSLEPAAFTLLKPGATCLLELDPRTIEDALKQTSSWATIHIRDDLTGRKRFLDMQR